jgi:hypothetical protein
LCGRWDTLVSVVLANIVNFSRYFVGVVRFQLIIIVFCHFFLEMLISNCNVLMMKLVINRRSLAQVNYYFYSLSYPMHMFFIRFVFPTRLGTSLEG